MMRPALSRMATCVGIAFNVDRDEIGVVLLGDYSLLQAGDEVERTGESVVITKKGKPVAELVRPRARKRNARGVQPQDPG